MLQRYCPEATPSSESGTSELTRTLDCSWTLLERRGSRLRLFRRRACNSRLGKISRWLKLRQCNSLVKSYKLEAKKSLLIRDFWPWRGNMSKMEFLYILAVATRVANGVRLYTWRTVCSVIMRTIVLMRVRHRLCLQRLLMKSTCRSSNWTRSRILTHQVITWSLISSMKAWTQRDLSLA